MKCDNCNNLLATDEEKEVGLCLNCYDEYLENRILERKHPDE